MKMEYLAAGSADCPLIRLYDFTVDELVQLCDLFNSLASGAVRSIALHEQPYLVSLQGCCLTLRAAERDRGIVEDHLGGFDCLLTPDGWEDQAERVKPVIEDSRGDFVWLLYNIPSEIRLLLSWNGTW
jgi:hypothetical protein